MRDWSKFEAPWYKKERFNPHTLQPFDKVLVRDMKVQDWDCGLFTCIYENEVFPFACHGNCYKFCIPYNDDTKHLVGNNDEAPEYYRYWEK